jgi:hypothetical protein
MEQMFAPINNTVASMSHYEKVLCSNSFGSLSCVSLCPANGEVADEHKGGEVVIQFDMSDPTEMTDAYGVLIRKK